mmetsp:Transcript_12959/g.27332  ORF Transcript_12959/g.27332 Transcript_12959/m.27332 type:complete len:249 (+) Transcript_12959:324-1070(+)
MTGKKSKKSSAESSSSVPKMMKVAGVEASLEESLEKALAALNKNQHQMLGLHRSWKSQLQRISFMVLIIVLKQSSIPVSDCLEQIQTWNEQITASAATASNDDSKGRGGLLDESLRIGDWDAGKYCLADSVMEILSILCCLSLIWLMYQPLQGKNFTDLPFRIAVSFVPLILLSYYNNQMMGCLEDFVGNGEEKSGVSKPRTFPVVLIFLVVSFASLYMMRYQQKQQDENIQKIEKLKENLLANKKQK